MIRRYLPHDTQQMALWYERYLSPIALVAGFILDTLYLTRRVDLWQTNALLFSYLVLAALGITLINILETGRIRHPRMITMFPLIPVVVQFAFGGLFSGYLSLYSRSASLAVSWLFVLALAFLLIGNERFTRLYVRFPFQVGIYFAALFSFFIFFLPVVFKEIGMLVFLASGAVSIAVIALLLAASRLLAPGIARTDWLRAIGAVAVVYAVINGLYFADIIPPLPLSLKDAGVYHSVERQPDGSYLLTAEPRAWYEEYLRYETTYHQGATSSAPVYVWSTVFAPTGLSTTIKHQWQRYDEAARIWMTTDSVSFPITGGRDGGYRGYTAKAGVSPGRWRVNVLAEGGKLITRIGFTVVAADAPHSVVEVVR
jgi:hypothetical protein